MRSYCLHPDANLDPKTRFVHLGERGDALDLVVPVNTDLIVLGSLYRASSERLSWFFRK